MSTLVPSIVRVPEYRAREEPREGGTFGPPWMLPSRPSQWLSAFRAMLDPAPPEMMLTRFVVQDIDEQDGGVKIDRVDIIIYGVRVVTLVLNRPAYCRRERTEAVLKAGSNGAAAFTTAVWLAGDLGSGLIPEIVLLRPGAPRLRHQNEWESSHADRLGQMDRSTRAFSWQSITIEPEIPWDARPSVTATREHPIVPEVRS